LALEERERDKRRPVVNFTNILWAAFAPIFFAKKLQVENTFV